MLGIRPHPQTPRGGCRTDVARVARGSQEALSCSRGLSRPGSSGQVRDAADGQARLGARLGRRGLRDVPEPRAEQPRGDAGAPPPPH